MAPSPTRSPISARSTPFAASQGTLLRRRTCSECWPSLSKPRGRIMKGVRLFVSALILAWATVAHAGKVVVLTLEGVIDPVAAQYISRGIATAEKEGAECLVLALD